MDVIMNMKHLSLVVLIGVTSMGCNRLGINEVEDTPQGTYDAESRYDMSTFAGLFAGLAPQWRQPDVMIQNQILASVDSQYGSTIGGLFRSAVGAQLQGEITGYMNEKAPPWLMQIGPTMDEVDEQMQTVDVQNTILVAEQLEGENYEVTQIWNGIAVVEDPACRDSGQVIPCDQIQIGSDSLLDAEYPVEIVSTRYEATESGDQLDMGAHSVDLNYGRLGLYLMTNQILPDEPTEGIGLRDVALGAINCRGLAGRLAGQDDVYGVQVGGVDVGISLNDLVGNCQEGVLASVNGFVDQFNVPLGMDLQGSARMVDVNRDGRVDQLTGGNLDGNMNVQLLSGQAEQGPVTGKFVGFRVGDIE